MIDKKETAMSKVQIIINPASGIERPILKILNKAFGKVVEWDVSITHKNGDAHRFAEKALADGATIVAVYGGDGTVTEVANVLAGGDVPLAILPGGTGNGVARMLNIPMDLEPSAALLTRPHELRAIDLGRVNNKTFMLRADIGFMAVTGAETPRMIKDRYGKWAYAISSVEHRALLKPIPYRMVLDGEEVEVQGVLCMVINTGAVAFGHRPLAKGIAPDDGLLDVLVLTRNDLVALGEVASSAFLGNPTPMHHWQVKTAVIHTDPPQAMSVDGELIENSPAQIQILPHTVKVIVPKTAVPA
jgi:YegS/Rv2252/BmrU family lipid kinase